MMSLSHQHFRLSSIRMVPGERVELTRASYGFIGGDRSAQAAAQLQP